MAGRGLGRAHAVGARGRVHWGWFFKLKRRPMKVILACGRSVECSGPSVYSASKVNCPACLKKAKEDPKIIKGGAK